MRENVAREKAIQVGEGIGMGCSRSYHFTPFFSVDVKAEVMVRQAAALDK